MDKTFKYSCLPDHADLADPEADSAFQKGASSTEDHRPAAVSHINSEEAGTSIDSCSPRPPSDACWSADEPQRAESVGEHIPCQRGKDMLPSQPSSSSSIYDTPQPSISSMSQASAAGVGLDKDENHLLSACSSSCASTGIRGGRLNPYYACSASSASSGSALPQRQRFWPHAAPAAPSDMSSTAQSIPEAEVSQV